MAWLGGWWCLTCSYSFYPYFYLQIIIQAINSRKGFVREQICKIQVKIIPPQVHLKYFPLSDSRVLPPSPPALPPLIFPAITLLFQENPPLHVLPQSRRHLVREQEDSQTLKTSSQTRRVFPPAQRLFSVTKRLQDNPRRIMYQQCVERQPPCKKLENLW